jgi:tetratricopeptide (TPR) repeat protein
MGITHLSRVFYSEIAAFKGLSSKDSSGDRANEVSLLHAHNVYPYSVHTAFELGNIYMKRMEEGEKRGFRGEVITNAERAVWAYTDGLRTNPSYDEIFFSRAAALRRLERNDESELDLRMALLINPLRKEIYHALDSLVAKKNSAQTSRRIALWVQAVHHFPDDFSVRLQMAKTYEQEGRREKAHGAYEWCLNRDLDNTLAWAGVNRTGLPIDPRLSEGKNLLASVRSDATANQWERAHRHAEKLVTDFPDYPLALLIAADTAAQCGDNSTAISRYRQFLNLQPDHPEALENLKKVMERSDAVRPIDPLSSLQ